MGYFRCFYTKEISIKPFKLQDCTNSLDWFTIFPKDRFTGTAKVQGSDIHYTNATCICKINATKQQPINQVLMNMIYEEDLSSLLLPTRI